MKEQKAWSIAEPRSFCNFINKPPVYMRKISSSVENATNIPFLAARLKKNCAVAAAVVLPIFRSLDPTLERRAQVCL
jgi:hypothetical protein